MNLTNQIANVISIALENEWTAEQVELLLEKPKQTELGDIAFPCFTLAKKFRKAPQQIALELSAKLEDQLIASVQVAGGYVNIFLNQAFVTNQVLHSIMTDLQKYGSKNSMHEKIVIDFSSPNIAKPFSMGHLRSTVIGNSLANIAEKNGYEALRINHLGDWGTQFGKLIVAYKLWGNKEKILAAPIEELLKIYVHFHNLAEKDDSLNDQARAAFKSLEEGDEEALTLWNWFKEASLKEFQIIYELLGVHFDSYAGEAFYNDKMTRVVDDLKKKGLLIESNGAFVVELEDMPPSLITKKDGATLYATRDLAAAIYRHQTFHACKTFYVVGNEQTLHFKQLFSVLEKMGFEWSKNLVHVPFGMMLKDGKKMSTRKGKVILLADVITDAIKTAQHNIEEKNPTLENKEEVAKQVGVGAVIFNDLKNDRMNDIEFSLEQMLNFEGETGPYVQYTNARICSLLQKGSFEVEAFTFSSIGVEAWPIIQLLEDFPRVVEKAFDNADPSQIAKFSLLLARQFNKYYARTKILADDGTTSSKLAFAFTVSVVLKESLRLLGVPAPEKM
ncbi:arginine--tRNA ligase [Psychrobacillus psychrodurans]|uniref:arginine--tRNA ligase n=1 Tax=Psychrobacillus psychrodurans TaxID=126157 RepID=UPI0008DF08F2|nr:arginine--tRNA ligase [Psychrobacillus psychrodurans]MCZ8539759.1 arginine--tRNA ligase [Psychrobacillus psychrodurans]SFM93012.1 arginyl-tRNA synthetase [Psychrobacillus psychrodurans]